MHKFELGANVQVNGGRWIGSIGEVVAVPSATSVIYSVLLFERLEPLAFDENELAAIPPRFPHRGFRCGAVISLSGVLLRAADACQRSSDSKHLDQPLRTLLTHIEMLRAAKNDNEALRLLNDFLALWVGN